MVGNDSPALSPPLFRSESITSSDTDPVFYNDDERLPVHEWGLAKEKKINEIADILLNKAGNGTNVATAIPTDVSKNTTFIIDTSHLDLLEDLRCDDLGVWHCTGVKIEFFKRKRGSIKKVDTKKGRGDFITTTTSTA